MWVSVERREREKERDVKCEKLQKHATIVFNL